MLLRNVCKRKTSERLHQIKQLFFCYVCYYQSKVCVKDNFQLASLE